MSLADPPPRTMTAEELLALPDDGIHREIIGGELRERPMTKRNRWHSGVEAKIAKILGNWLDGLGPNRGAIHSGEAGFRLKHNPETFVGIDVAFVSAELAAKAPGLPFFEGAPVLAVEILSPSDPHEDVVEKVRLYLEVGTVVWVVDPDLRHVIVYEPGREGVMFSASQELVGDPYLPGFRVRVAEIFA